VLVALAAQPRAWHALFYCIFQFPATQLYPVGFWCKEPLDGSRGLSMGAQNLTGRCIPPFHACVGPPGTGASRKAAVTKRVSASVLIIHKSQCPSAPAYQCSVVQIRNMYMYVYSPCGNPWCPLGTLG